MRGFGRARPQLKLATPVIDEDVWSPGLSCSAVHAAVPFDMPTATLEQIQQFCTTSNIRLPSDPLLSIYLREMKIYSHEKTCTEMLLGALFIISETENNQNACHHSTFYIQQWDI